MNEFESPTSTCPKCGYTQGRTADNKCPACGTQFASSPVTTHKALESGDKWGADGKLQRMVNFGLAIDKRLAEEEGNAQGGKPQEIVIDTTSRKSERPQRNALQKATDKLFGRKICPNCGASVSGNANFCHQCRHQF